MPTEQKLLDARWTLLIKKDDIDTFEKDVDLKIKYNMPCMFSDDYRILLVETLILGQELTAEDVLDMSGAIVVHEEYTNGFVMRDIDVDEVNEIYCWTGAGACLMGEMLTDIEKAQFLLKYLYTQNKERIELGDIEIYPKKDDKPICLEDHFELMATEFYGFSYKGGPVTTLWWPFIIADTGLFLVVITDDIDDEDDDEEETKLLPGPSGYKSYDDYYQETAWGNIYDDYDYDDRYYRRT